MAQRKRADAPTQQAAHRVRLTVPADDAVSLQWLAAQASVSSSLRLLIREAMLEHGPIDALSRPLAVPGAHPVPRPAPAEPAPAPTSGLLGAAVAAAAAPAASVPEPVAAAPARPEQSEQTDQPTQAQPAQRRAAAAPAPAPSEQSQDAAGAAGTTDISGFFSRERG